MNKKQVKRMLTLALPLMIAVPAMAQQSTAETFKPHWYVQPQVGASWTVGEYRFDKLLSPAASLSLGHQFSPLFGLRINASGWQGRNWQVTPLEEYKWQQVQTSADATLSLSNLVAGYETARHWNLYGFIGAGLNFAFGNDDASQLAIAHPIEFGKVWNGTKLFTAMRAGLGVEIAISKQIAIGLEANANILPDKWNSKKGRNSNMDWQNHLLLGVKIALGKASRTEAYMDAPADPATDTEEQQIFIDVAPVMEETQPAAEVQETHPSEKTQSNTVEDKLTSGVQKMDTKIYFQLAKADIMANQDEKLRKAAQFMQTYRKMVMLVIGQASPDGNYEKNLELSKSRAEAVKRRLMHYGVSENRIRCDYRGAVENGDPIESRSVICLTIE